MTIKRFKDNKQTQSNDIAKQLVLAVCCPNKVPEPSPPAAADEPGVRPKPPPAPKQLQQY